MTTTQELIAQLMDKHDMAVTPRTRELFLKSAKALEALQAEVARLIAAYNMGTESYRALEKERDAALARERHTRETLNKFMEAGASPQPVLHRDALVVNLLRLTNLDKHTARAIADAAINVKGVAS